MSRMTAPADADVAAASRPPLDAAARQLGFVPNMYRALATTSKALNAWLGLRKAMSASLDDEIARNCGRSSSDTRRAAALALRARSPLPASRWMTARWMRCASAGFTDGQILEIVAVVVLFTMSNYFNNVMKTDIDVFPNKGVGSAAEQSA
jgi:hypothetical protein